MSHVFIHTCIHAYKQKGVSRISDSSIGPDKDRMSTLKCVYFPTLQFKHVFWVLKRTVSLRQFFFSTHNIQHMFWLRNKKNNFQIRTLIWRPELFYLIFQLRSFNKRLWLKCSQLQLNYYMKLLSTRTIVTIKRCLFVPHPIGERYYILHMINSKSKTDTSMLGHMYSHIMSPHSMTAN